jgi:deoxyadenosine/deoxycytidine kinase
MPHVYLVIEGPIGVGKTALTRLMSEQLGIPALFEQFEENPFLSKFYADPERYAFQTEVFFLLNRYRQQRDEVLPAVEKGDLVCDYMFAKTKLFAGMNLAGDEWTLFEQIYDALSERVPKPQLTVYLRASVDTLMNRIYQRDRWFEREMRRAYIERLSKVYEDFFATYADSPLLTVATDEFDFVQNPTARQHIMALITSAIESVRRKA